MPVNRWAQSACGSSCEQLDVDLPRPTWHAGPSAAAACVWSSLQSPVTSIYISQTNQHSHLMCPEVNMSTLRAVKLEC